MKIKNYIVIGAILSLMVIITSNSSLAATITFDNLDVFADQEIVEDGMRYKTTDNFVVRSFVGNPPSGLIGSPITNQSFIITKDGGGNFTFDRYDFASFAPGQQSDTWEFRGLLNGVQQFAFLASTSMTFVTRTVNLSNPIDELEISVVSGSVAAAVADNFVFTFGNAVFAGIPGKANCHGKSVSALAKKFRGLDEAASVLGFANVKALQDAITKFCEE